MPTSMPRTRSVLTIGGRLLSVTGKAEKVASVVHELVHVHAAEQRGRALLGADEIDRQQQNKAGENRPRQPFAKRNRVVTGSVGANVVVVILVLLGLRVPVRAGSSRRGSDSRPANELRPEYSGATVPDSHRLPHLATTNVP